MDCTQNLVAKEKIALTFLTRKETKLNAKIRNPVNTEPPVAILLSSTNLAIERLRLSQEDVRIKICGLLWPSTNLAIELLRLSQEDVRIEISGLLRLGEGLRFSGP